MLDALEAQGLAANTLVAYVSDHGELLGQHGMWWKCSFYEGSVRIPFMLAWPEHIPSNRRFARVTSLLDLVRTVLAAAGDTAPDLDGTDLMPLMTGAVLDGDGIALAEYAAHGTIMPARMVRHGRYKLNYYHGEPPELFDLEDDPDEFENLAAHPAYELTGVGIRR